MFVYDNFNLRKIDLFLFKSSTEYLININQIYSIFLYAKR